ncbi:MAG: hypothetical protein WAW67_06780 [Candidatus Omnitrophota bacterium]
MIKYKLEFILSTFNVDKQNVRNSLLDSAEDLEIIEALDKEINGPEELKINLLTSEPTIIFDICSQFGRIKSIKVEEKLN